MNAKTLLDLPNELLIQILEKLSYEEVANNRIVCKRFDGVCQTILNSGFQKVSLQHAVTYKRIKSMLPRRESERRNFALARHVDILTSVDTRLSMLSMTYTKYMDLNLCCFIPGRVLDEILRILRLTTLSKITLRPLEILQEFRDISSMAIEHFEEKICGDFKKIIERNVLIKTHSIGALGSNCFNRRTYLSDTMLGTSMESSERKDFDNRLLLRILPVTSDVATTSQRLTAAQANTETESNSSSSLKVYSNDYSTKKNLKTMQKKYLQMSKNMTFFRRKVNRLTSQMNNMKRRLDELESKNHELIGTIRQYNYNDTQKDTGEGLCDSQSNKDTVNQCEIPPTPVSQITSKAKKRLGVDFIPPSKGNDESDDDVNDSGVVLKKLKTEEMK